MFAGAGGVCKLLIGQKHQRMQRGIEWLAAADQGVFGAALLEATLSEQYGQQLFEGKPLVMRRCIAHKQLLGRLQTLRRRILVCVFEA